MDATLAGVVGGLIGTFGTLILGIGSFYAVRRSTYRQHLYEKQVDVCIAIMDSLVPFYIRTMQAMTTVAVDDNGFPLNKTARIKIRQDTVNEWNAFLLQNTRQIVLYPSFLIEALDQFMEVWEEATDFGREQPSKYDADPQQALGEAYGRVVGAVRKTIAVDPLSEQTLKIVGAAKIRT